MSEQLLNMPKNLARASPYIIFCSGILVSLATGNPLGAIFTFLAIVLGDVFNLLFKTFFKKISPDRKSWQRPMPPPEGCCVMGKCPTTGHKTFGMPSGHSQTASLAAAFWLLYLFRKSQATPLALSISTFFILFFVVFIMNSRVLAGCHTAEQVLTGMTFGIVLGVGGYFLLERYYPEVFD